MLKPDFISNKIKKNKILNKMIFFKKIDSTNDYLKKNDLPDGIIILSETQAKGRGKYGRIWLSPKGGLWFSFLRKEKTKIPYKYVILSSVVLFEILKKYSKDVKIKWPNDILVNSKKISGILVENDYFNQKVIIGIGININNHVPKNLDFPAISLKQITGKNVDINQIFIDILKKLDFYINYFSDKKNKIFQIWKKNLINLNEENIKELTILNKIKIKA